MATAKIKLPPKLKPVFLGKARYRGSFGGRGSGKTRSFAKMAAVWGYQFGMAGQEGVILCAREHLNSLEESSMEEIKHAIREEAWLEAYYEIGEKFIRSRDGRIKFLFAGLRRNVDSIKSKARVLLCWVDEAENVMEESWRKLIPTVREEGSEIWVTWNPESKESATHKRFRESTPDDAKIVELNWRDNPWFPDVLDRERREDKEKRADTYDHVWEGDFLIYADGAYYVHEMRKARDDGRIGRVPYDPALPVWTSWDLGIGDSTAIWFAQFCGAEKRLIDYYEACGVGLDHYVSLLKGKPYIYGGHILPHDVQVHELGTGKSRLDTLRALGISDITIAPKLAVDDGIQAARSFIAGAWFDAEKCARGVDALRQYRRDYDDKGKMFKSRPLHDWTSHGADAFRYLAVGHRPSAPRVGPRKRRSAWAA